jgi:hypothetical protein
LYLSNQQVAARIELADNPLLGKFLSFGDRKDQAEAGSGLILACGPMACSQSTHRERRNGAVQITARLCLLLGFGKPAPRESEQRVPRRKSTRLLTPDREYLHEADSQLRSLGEITGRSLALFA